MAFSVQWTAGFNATPLGSDDPKYGDDRIRELKLAVYERLAVEHNMDLTEAGTQPRQALHKAGSAVPFYQASAPTQRLNGVALAAVDNGALWIDSDDNALYVYVHGTGWIGILSATARAWLTSRTISLTGKCSGSAAFNGGGNFDLQVTAVTADSCTGNAATATTATTATNATNATNAEFAQHSDSIGFKPAPGSPSSPGTRGDMAINLSSDTPYLWVHNGYGWIQFIGDRSWSFI